MKPGRALRKACKGLCTTVGAPLYTTQPTLHGFGNAVRLEDARGTHWYIGWDPWGEWKWEKVQWDLPWAKPWENE